jgi:hypothetical protein
VAFVANGIIFSLPLSPAEVAKFYPGYRAEYVNDTFVLVGFFFVVAGAGLAGIAVANLRNHVQVRAISIITTGLGAIGIGTFDMRLHRSATIANLIGFDLVNIIGGAALVAAGIAYLCGKHNMLGIAATVGGTAIIANGVPFPSESGALLPLTAICGGLVVTGFGVAACLRAPTFAAARARWQRLTREPANEPS